MSGLIFFIPDCADAPVAVAKRLAEHGLTDLCDGAGRGCQHGPDGLAGVTISSAGASRQTGYNAASQTWHKGRDGRWWFGWETEAPPGPDDLARPKMMRGEAVRLGDGREWVVPWAVYLPREFDLDPHTGDWVESAVVVEKYRPLHAAGARLWEFFGQARPAEDGSVTVTMRFSEMAELGALALRFNYAVNDEIVAALRLFDTENVQSVASAIAGLNPLARLQQEVEARGKGAASPSN